MILTEQDLNDLRAQWPELKASGELSPEAIAALAPVIEAVPEKNLNNEGAKAPS